MWLGQSECDGSDLKVPVLPDGQTRPAKHQTQETAENRLDGSRVGLRNGSERDIMVSEVVQLQTVRTAVRRVMRNLEKILKFRASERGVIL